MRAALKAMASSGEVSEEDGDEGSEGDSEGEGKVRQRTHCRIQFPSLCISDISIYVSVSLPVPDKFCSLLGLCRHRLAGLAGLLQHPDEEAGAEEGGHRAHRQGLRALHRHEGHSGCPEANSVQDGSHGIQSRI